MSKLLNLQSNPETNDALSVSREVKVIQRSAIPTLQSVLVDGRQYNLGILKDFRKHPDLINFIPTDGRLSISWVHLESGEMLEAHTHPTASMIVIAEGEGRVIGGLDSPLESGDIVAVPPECSHGFIGGGAGGFWALSIQFEGQGLYEDPEHARVSFGPHPCSEVESIHPRFKMLLERNKQFAHEHETNAIFRLVESERLADKRCCNRFLDCVQVWSECFQRAMMARSALAEDQRYAAMFREHLSGEFGHDAKLAMDRGSDLSRPWDPVLDAASNWFAWKMITLDNVEKTVLIHLVLEVGSILISTRARKVFEDTDYFEVHATLDSKHQEMSLILLTKLEDSTYDRLFQVQKEGWDMLNLLCTRIAELANEG